MNDFSRELYDTLVIGIGECEKNHTEFRRHIECCFHICESIVLELNKKIAATKFSPAEEIIFFKSIKPKFTCLVEFYSIVYRAELFVPEGKSEKQEYWDFEMKRAQQFLSKHQDFHNYMREGQTFRDEEYFHRKSENDSSASQDILLAQIMAHEMYIDLLRRRSG